jgi:hypothetical protein
LPESYKKLQNTTPEPAFIPKAVLQQTLNGYKQNVFIQNLLLRVPYPFEVKDVNKVIALYHLGTVCNGYRAGAITFPFIDKEGNIRAIQAKQFDATNHTTGTDFLHAIIEKQHQKRADHLPEWVQAYNRNEKKVSCLFGESLIKEYPFNAVALVEAPKSAIYGTLYFGFPERPENLLWLAVYNLSSLNIDKCKALQGRDVYLFPDLSKDGAAFNLWSKKAKELTEQMPGTRFEVSDLLEMLASKELKEKGADIADVLIQLDWKRFRNVLAPKEQQNYNFQQNITIETAAPEHEKPEKHESCKNNIISAKKAEPIPHETPLVIHPEIELKQAAPTYNFTKDEQKEPVRSENEVTELETYFNSLKNGKIWQNLATQPFKLNPYSTITNVPFFIESHFTVVKANRGKRNALPYLNRLFDLKAALTKNFH